MTNKNREIGGYFELELSRGEEYHKDAIRLNTGRNAFEYILRAKGYKKVYLPFYTCDVMLEPIQKLKLEYGFYHIDETFRPAFDFSIIKHDDVFVYNNYFGICDLQVIEVTQKCKNLIIDNSQAFYSKPIAGIDTFYSPRKFFGLPDGAYLYTDKLLNGEFEADISYQRFDHLLGRIDLGAEKFYSVFKKSDKALSNQPVKKMSSLTQSILSSIDYNLVADVRIRNFNYLHNELGKINKLRLEYDSSAVPMVYPLLIGNGSGLKKHLLENKIFVATYWPNVLCWANANSFAYNLSENLLALPIDQRYDITIMSYILGDLNKFEKSEI